MRNKGCGKTGAERIRQVAKLGLRRADQAAQSSHSCAPELVAHAGEEAAVVPQHRRGAVAVVFVALPEAGHRVRQRLGYPQHQVRVRAARNHCEGDWLAVAARDGAAAAGDVPPCKLARARGPVAEGLQAPALKKRGSSEETQAERCRTQPGYYETNSKLSWRGGTVRQRAR